MKPAVKKLFIRLLLVAAGLLALGISYFSIWRIRLANDVESQIAAIHAAGLPANGAEANDYYTAVPDAENAALKMAEAFALMTNYPDGRSNQVESIKFPNRKESLTQEQSELLAGYCGMNSKAIAQAGEAIKLTRCRYPMDLSWGAATLLPHLAQLKRLSKTASFRTLIGTNNPTADLTAIIGLARTLDNEPLLISKLVRLALLNTAATILENRLNRGNLTDVDLKSLGTLFAEASKTNQMANGLIGERAMYFQYFRMSMAEIQRLANSVENNDTRSGPPLPGSQPFIFKWSGFFERDLRYYLQAMETNISLAQAQPKDFVLISNIQDQIAQTSTRNHYILSMMLLPALGNAVVKEAKSLAQIYTTQTALAVERYRLANGKLPDNLDSLVPQFLSALPEDPFDGQPLRYHRLEKGYVIYSIGSDGEDNGGRERPANVKSTDKTPYDITFTVER